MTVFLPVLSGQVHISTSTIGDLKTFDTSDIPRTLQKYINLLYQDISPFLPQYFIWYISNHNHVK